MMRYHTARKGQDSGWEEIVVAERRFGKWVTFAILLVIALAMYLAIFWRMSQPGSPG